jgi:hypothetical protein
MQDNILTGCMMAGAGARKMQLRQLRPGHGTCMREAGKPHVAIVSPHYLQRRPEARAVASTHLGCRSRIRCVKRLSSITGFPRSKVVGLSISFLFPALPHNTAKSMISRQLLGWSIISSRIIESFSWDQDEAHTIMTLAGGCLHILHTY